MTGTPSIDPDAETTKRPEERIAPSGTIAVLLYAVELCGLFLLLALYKKGSQPLTVFLGAAAGKFLILSLVLLVAGSLALIHFARSSAGAWQSFKATLILNLFSLGLAFGVVELGIRVFTVETPAGAAFAGTPLLPRNWNDMVARYRGVLEKASTRPTFLVADADLGWTNGPNLHSADYNLDFQEKYLTRQRQRSPEDDSLKRRKPNTAALDKDFYVSSAEGLRSAQQGVLMAPSPAGRRIALVGDSFTFGLEVRYEETWGRQLELALGSQFEVLNFGVDGYGVDQSLLRYRRDVVPWHPEIVILSFISDDLRRTLCVYGFLCFPESEIPWTKPRFVMKDGKLASLNLPLSTADALFKVSSIEELPFAEYDPGFDPFEWQRRPYHASYAVRLLLSRFPRWPVERSIVAPEASRQINAEILRTFVRTAQDQHSTPVVVYLPSASSFGESSGGLSRSMETLKESGIPYLDMTDCVKRVAPDQRFVVLHYSAETNSAVADCLRRSLESLLGNGTAGKVGDGSHSLQ